MSEDNRKNGSKVPLKMVVKTLGPTVRKRDERKKLDGFTCKECENYYKSKGLSGDELKKCLKKCSRHRAQHSPPKTPEHFWDSDIPPIEECIRRGYLEVEEKSNKIKKRKCDKRLTEELNATSNSQSSDGQRVSF